MKMSFKSDGLSKKLKEIEKQINSFSKTTDKIVEAVYNGMADIIEKESYNIRYTQKFEEDGKHVLSNILRQTPISAIKNGNSYKIGVPITKDEDEDLYWNFYFTEYGAGMDASAGTYLGGYVEKRKKFERPKDKMEFGKPYKNMWVYDSNIYGKHEKSDVRFVNTSIRIRYIEYGRKLLEKNLEVLKEAQKKHTKFEVIKTI